MPKRHRPGVSASSVLRHVEDVVLATSGEDTFEIVFSVAAARISKTKAKSLRAAIAEAARRFPTLEVSLVKDASDELLEKVDELLAKSDPTKGSTLDAVFESLVPRVSKSDKGQFFTPRHVVDFVLRMLAPRADEVVVDPACGSGAFLAKSPHGFGCDVDARAIRVARLLKLAASADPSTITRGDGLRRSSGGGGITSWPNADVVATNPPFAGRASGDGFDVAKLVRTPERDVLFLERALTLLREGGRLGIVLPYNKASGATFASVRRWLVARARVLAIVGLPRETFLPHTSQRTFILFAKKRRAKEKSSPNERTMLMISERAGKDAGGEPIFARGSTLDQLDQLDHLDHDLDDVGRVLAPFLREEGFARARDVG